MRVRFGELSKPEADAREAACARAREAWACLRAGQELRAQELMREIDPRLTLAVFGTDDGEALIAELATCELCAWPLVELLLSVAPHDVGVALSFGRSAVLLEQALEEAREQHQVELERATFRAGFGRGHLLEITLAVPGGSGSENQQIAAENLVLALLGDRLFETWVGAVHVTPAPRGGPLRVLDVAASRSSLHLHELFATVSAATLGVLRGLPSPSHASSAGGAGGGDAVSGDVGDVGDIGMRDDVDGAAANDEREGWTLLEVEPVDVARGAGKDDLVLASTCTPELLRCYLDGSPFASRRFSRTGERFVFVSYADDEPTMERRVAKRNVIEAALCEAVTGIGVVTGVGLGVRTTYVDLGLCNLETGLARLVSKLRDVGAPERTFIQFFDSELADEWLSIWPDIRLTEE